VSGITAAGGILIQAGTHRIDTSDGGYLNVDKPISRELADVIAQTIAAEGLTPRDVMAIEFRGEGRPIITSIDEEYLKALRDEQHRLMAEWKASR